jgi:hypothetical protein
MKNFGSILAFLAVSATIVSGRALPVEKGVEARAPYPVGKTPTYSIRDFANSPSEVAEIYAREHKKDKAAGQYPTGTSTYFVANDE